MNIIYKDCKYCGRPTKPNVLTVHENSCKLNPENNYTKEPQKFVSEKKFLNSQKLLVDCSICGKAVEIGYAHLKNKFLKFNRQVLCLSCNQRELYKNKDWKENRLEKIKETYRKRYGLEHFFQTDEFKIKTRETFEKHHTKSFYSENAKKIWKNMTPEKLALRERKSQETKKEKYGSLERANQKMRESFEKNCLEKYGCLPTQLKEVRQKMSESMKNEGLEKRKQTCRKRYGKDYYSSTEDFKTSYKNTLKLRYGVENGFLVGFLKGMNFTRSGYNYNGLHFDSKAEVVFYLKCIEDGLNVKREPKMIAYEFNNKIHHYIPDFEVDGKLYEIKGTQFLKNGKWQNIFDHSKDELYEKKRQIALQNNVEILYVDEKFLKEYKPFYEKLKSLDL